MARGPNLLQVLLVGFVLSLLVLAFPTSALAAKGPGAIWILAERVFKDRRGAFKPALQHVHLGRKQARVFDLVAPGGALHD